MSISIRIHAYASLRCACLLGRRTDARRSHPFALFLAILAFAIPGQSVFAGSAGGPGGSSVSIGTSAAPASASASTQVATSSGPSNAQLELERSDQNPIVSDSATQLRDLLTTAPLELTLHDGLDGLREEVIPYMASLAGANQYQYFEPMLIFGPQNALCAKLKSGFDDLSLIARVFSDDVSGTFGRDARIQAELDLSGTFSGEFYFQAREIDNTGCDLAEFFLGLTNLGDLFDGGQVEVQRTAEYFSVSDLEVTLDGHLGVVDERAQIVALDQLDVRIGSIGLDGYGLLDTLADIAADLLLAGCEGLFGTTSIDLCAQRGLDLLAAENVVPSLEELAQDALNGALGDTLRFESGPVAAGGASLDFAVALTDIDGSRAENSLTASFAGTISSPVATDPCATGVSFLQPLGSGDPTATDADLDVHIPLGWIGETLFEIARQGELCFTTAMTDSTGVSHDVDVRPYGRISVEEGIEYIEDDELHAVWVAHWNELRIRIPFVADMLDTGGSGVASGTLQVYAGLELRDRRLFLAVTEIEVVEATGMLTPPFGPSIDVSTQVDRMANSAADRIERRLRDQPILPRVTALPDHLALVLQAVRTNASYITAGLDIEYADPAPPETGIDGPGGGGGTNTPDLDPEFFEPLDHMPRELEVEGVEPTHDTGGRGLRTTGR